MSHDHITTTEENQEAALNIIRIETALSRFPVHRLANKGTISINIRRKDEKGANSLVWEVTYNSKYGQPGPLAYRLDTLVINRRIDEVLRPVPKVLKLGSLREIADELGHNQSGENTSAIKKALRQNASAFITAKITYKTPDKTERTLEADFNRYSIVFTGEKLPDGRKADCVYLVLNDIYEQVLNTATRRPLDYDYLRELAPAAQRFYEIVSYEMLPAIRHNQRAKLPYSEFCLYSTITRYFTFDQVKKQMYKIHKPHIDADYIEKVEYEATVDEVGNPDWNMFYQPGERARFQQMVFLFEIPYIKRAPKPKVEPATKKPKPVIPMQAEELPLLPKPEPTPGESAQAKALVERFYRLRFGQAQAPSEREIGQATELLREDREWAAYLVEFAAKLGKESGKFPDMFGGVRQLAAQAKPDFDARRKKERDARLNKARQSHEERFYGLYLTFLTQTLARLEETLPEVYRAFHAQERSTYQFHNARAEKSKVSADMIATFYSDENRTKRLVNFIKENPRCGIPTFWQWDERLNPERFSEA